MVFQPRHGVWRGRRLSSPAAGRRRKDGSQPVPGGANGPTSLDYTGSGIATMTRRLAIGWGPTRSATTPILHSTRSARRVIPSIASTRMDDSRPEIRPPAHKTHHHPWNWVLPPSCSKASTRIPTLQMEVTRGLSRLHNRFYMTPPPLQATSIGTSQNPPASNFSYVRDTTVGGPLADPGYGITTSTAITTDQVEEQQTHSVPKGCSNDSANDGQWRSAS